MIKMNKKGTEDMSFLTIIEIFVVAVLILLSTMIFYGVYKSLYGPDKQSLNSYKQIASNVQALAKNPTNNKETTMLFPFECNGIIQFWEKWTGSKLTDEEKAFKKFKGTIFFVSSNGEISDPIPEYERYKNFKNKWVSTDKKYFNQINPEFYYIAREKLPKECLKTACICYSEDSITDEDLTISDVKSIVMNPYDCKEIKLKEGQEIQFFRPIIPYEGSSPSFSPFENLCEDVNNYFKADGYLDFMLKSQVSGNSIIMNYYFDSARVRAEAAKKSN